MATVIKALHSTVNKEILCGSEIDMNRYIKRQEMKRFLIAAAMLFAASCGSNGNSNSNTTSTTDTSAKTDVATPTAPDTLKHPGGVDNSEVISTDTAATNVKNSIDKAKAAKNKKP